MPLHCRNAFALLLRFRTAHIVRCDLPSSLLLPGSRQRLAHLVTDMVQLQELCQQLEEPEFEVRRIMGNAYFDQLWLLFLSWIQAVQIVWN